MHRATAWSSSEQAWLECSRTTSVMLAGLLLTPLVACVRRIERLAPISFAASALVAVFVCHVLSRYARLPGASVSQLLHDPTALPPSRGSSLLHALSVVNLSYQCNFNVLPLLHSLPAAPARLMHQVTCVAYCLAFGVYALVGLLGSLTFDGAASGNIFADYARASPFGATLDNLIALAQLLSLPLLAHDGVHELVAMCSRRPALLAERDGLIGTLGAGTTTSPCQPHARHGRGLPAQAEAACGVLWCTISTAVALVAPDTSRVLHLLSALCGFPLMYVFPTLMLLRSGHGMGRCARRLNELLLCCGMAMTAACSATAIASLFVEPGS